MSRIAGARLTRRTFVAAGVGAGVSLALGPLAHAASPPAPLITRPIPSTGERLPVIGLGTNAYGVTDPAEYAARKEVLEQMPGLGGTVIDTAYGYGDSELVIGRALKELGNRGKFFLATKTPIRGDVSGGASLVEESFTRLQVETLDLMQIHNLHGLDTFMPVLLEMKAAKRVRYLGMSTSTDEQYPAFLEALGRYPVDFLQVDYSVGNRSAAERILPFAQEKGIAVLVNMPLGGRRGPMFGQVRGREVPEWAREADIRSWAQFFLKYVVSHPAVTCAIPGTTKASNLADNQGAGRGRLPDAAMRKRMEEFWDAV
ncbi:MAG: aldo/keto reductase [Steroidobacteraceae bacterium]|jgi:aryl-alcohol dehydrogenase-like predicted oxidoreductase|nr:aldo/keto reductase [Steroidobacteraceae bacterium]